MSKNKHEIKHLCGRNFCGTYFEITQYDCGCVTVHLHNKADQCLECVPKIPKEKHCGQFGYPEDHKKRE